MTFKPITIEIINNDGSSWFFNHFENYKQAIDKLETMRNIKKQEDESEIVWLKQFIITFNNSLEAFHKEYITERIKYLSRVNK